MTWNFKTRFWREIYFRLTLAGGLLAFLLISAGWTSIFDPRSEGSRIWPERRPAPVVMRCDENRSLASPVKLDHLSWCQASHFQSERGLDSPKTENIF